MKKKSVGRDWKTHQLHKPFNDLEPLLWVMYAQVHGDSAQQAGSTYEAVTEGPGLPNGVVQRQEPAAPPGSSLYSALENPNIGEMTLPVDRTGVATAQLIPQHFAP